MSAVPRQRPLADPSPVRGQAGQRLSIGRKYMVASAFCFSLMSPLVKLAGQRFPTMELVFARALVVSALARGYLAENKIPAEMVSPERRIFRIHRVVASETVLAVPPEHAATGRRLLQEAERSAVLIEGDEEGDESAGGNA